MPCPVAPHSAGSGMRPNQAPSRTGIRLAGGVPMNRATKAEAGSDSSRSGGSNCSIRPPFITATWVAMVIASIWS